MRIRQEYLYIILIGLGLIFLLRNVGFAFSIMWPILLIIAGIIIMNPASTVLNSIAGIGASLLSLAIIILVMFGIAAPIFLLLLIILGPILLVVFGIIIVSVGFPFLVMASPIILIVLVLAALF